MKSGPGSSTWSASSSRILTTHHCGVRGAASEIAHVDSTLGPTVDVQVAETTLPFELAGLGEHRQVLRNAAGFGSSFSCGGVLPTRSHGGWRSRRSISLKTKMPQGTQTSKRLEVVGIFLLNPYLPRFSRHQFWTARPDCGEYPDGRKVDL